MGADNRYGRLRKLEAHPRGLVRVENMEEADRVNPIPLLVDMVVLLNKSIVAQDIPH
jgi:hypothetical protein